jgi:hypothetical protein
LVLSTSSWHRFHVAPKAERHQRRGERDWLEGAAPLAQEVSELLTAGNNQRKIITAVGRELLVFIWAIGRMTGARGKQPALAA